MSTQEEQGTRIITGLSKLIEENKKLKQGQSTLDSILSYCTSQPENAECMYLAGVIYEKKLDGTKAKEYYKRAAEKEHLPAKIQSILLEHNLSQEFNQTVPPQHLALEISTLARNTPELELKIALYTLSQKMYNSITTQYNIGYCYELLGKLTQAQEVYSQIISQNQNLSLDVTRKRLDLVEKKLTREGEMMKKEQA